MGCGCGLLHTAVDAGLATALLAIVALRDPTVRLEHFNGVDGPERVGECLR